ncbi:MAG TPA: PQQ-binding-like beta-propeller repeat protein [Ktedonobacterales bacterium]|nr:PQQ-binding-like beta-propeller repeat protein [Ktedonobacterales bacterium]
MSSNTGAPLSSILTALNTADGATRWSFTRNNEGFYTPEIANGVAYFMARNGNDTGLSGHLYALDTADGSQRWMVDVGAQAGANTFALSNGVFLAGGSATGVTAFRASDGAQLWTNTDPMFTYFIVVGHAVYVKSFNSAAIALDVTTGKVLWSTRVLVSAPTTPPTAANGLLYVSGGRDSGQVAAINISTGVIRWIQRMPGTIGFPVIAGDAIYVYTMQPDNGPSPVVYAFSAADGTLRWQHQTGKNLEAGLTVTGQVDID